MSGGVTKSVLLYVSGEPESFLKQAGRLWLKQNIKKY